MMFKLESSYFLGVISCSAIVTINNVQQIDEVWCWFYDVWISTPYELISCVACLAVCFSIMVLLAAKSLRLSQQKLQNSILSNMTSSSDCMCAISCLHILAQRPYPKPIHLPPFACLSTNGWHLQTFQQLVSEDAQRTMPWPSETVAASANKMREVTNRKWSENTR